MDALTTRPTRRLVGGWGEGGVGGAGRGRSGGGGGGVCVGGGERLLESACIHDQHWKGAKLCDIV